MLKIMQDVSSSLADYHYLKASVHLHSQPGQRSEQKRLGGQIRSALAKIRAGIAELKSWDKAKGGGFNVNIQGLNAEVIITAGRCPWEGSSGQYQVLSPVMLEEAKALLQKAARVDEELEILKREGADALEYFKYYTAEGQRVLQRLQHLQQAVKAFPSSPLSTWQASLALYHDVLPCSVVPELTSAQLVIHYCEGKAKKVQELINHYSALYASSVRLWQWVPRPQSQHVHHFVELDEAVIVDEVGNDIARGQFSSDSLSGWSDHGRDVGEDGACESEDGSQDDLP